MNRFRIFAKSIRKLMNIEDRNLVVVCGCTGTGKSDLGIEIAEKFNGEIISADSMQIYKGLDIVTNKVTNEEMKGIPHHMMSFYEPWGDKYNVHDFRNEVLKLMDKIWKAGKLPIIVGGTIYYIESILYENYLIPSDKKTTESIREKLLASNYSNDELYEMLKEVDPETALINHRNNRYKVLRALEIFHSTGKTKSEHLAEQKRRAKSIFSSKQTHLGGKLRLPFENILLINLDASKEVLDNRLDKRVDKMVEKGLLKELEGFYEEYSFKIGTKGIMQSIGLKEFIPYLKMDSVDRKSSKGLEAFKDGCNLLKTHTRQYCRAQRNWLRNRFFLCSKTRQLPRCISLDTSTDFFEKVVPLGLDCVSSFLNGHSLPEKHSCIIPMEFFVAQSNFYDENYASKANGINFCEICQLEVQSEKSWMAHLKGRKHRKIKQLRRRKEEDTSKEDI